MENRSHTIKGFLLGLLTALALIATIGAVNSNTANTAGDTTTAFKAVDTSSDGKTVYVCDNDKVYRSTDGGANWEVVLKKRETGY